MRTIRLYPLPITSSRFPTGPHHLRVFSDLTASTITSSLSFSHMLFQSHSFTLATHSRVGSGTRVSYEHSSPGNHYVARERGLSVSGSRPKWTTSAGKHESRLRREVASARIHPGRASQNQNPARPGWTATGGVELLRSRGTRQSDSEGVIRGADRDASDEADPYRNRAVGDFGETHSRRMSVPAVGAGCVYARAAAATAAAPPSLCSLLETRGN